MGSSERGTEGVVRGSTKYNGKAPAGLVLSGDALERLLSSCLSSGPLGRPRDSDGGRELLLLREVCKDPRSIGQGLGASTTSESSPAGAKRKKGRRASIAPIGAALATFFGFGKGESSRPPSADDAASTVEANFLEDEGGWVGKDESSS